jgi:hypothetical protein
MAAKLNERAYQHARTLIADRRCVVDERDDWSEHRPSARAEDRFIEEHGLDAYEVWYLAVDDEHGEGTKARHKFPYGDFENVHRCGVISAESRAGQYRHANVEEAARHLLRMIDELR